MFLRGVLADLEKQSAQKGAVCAIGEEITEAHPFQIEDALDGLPCLSTRQGPDGALVPIA
jgi:hypothetical protein